MGVRIPKSSHKVIIIIIVIALLGSFALTLKHRQDKKNADLAIKTTLCNTDTIGRGIKKDTSVLEPSKVNLLKPFSDKIEVLANHDKSANCMFILTSYNAYIGNYPKAKSYYASLQALKSKGVRVSGNFNDQSKKLDEFMPNVDQIEKQYKSNAFTGGAGLLPQRARQNGQ